MEKEMFFKKNKNSQPAATVDQSTFGVSEMSDDDLIAVTAGGAGNSYPSSGSKNSSSSSVSGAAWNSSSAGAWTSSAGPIPTVNSSLFDLLAGGQRTSRVSLKLPY
jgi:hypothetical protein